MAACTVLANSVFFAERRYRAWGARSEAGSGRLYFLQPVDWTSFAGRGCADCGRLLHCHIGGHVSNDCGAGCSTQGPTCSAHLHCLRHHFLFLYLCRHHALRTCYFRETIILLRHFNCNMTFLLCAGFDNYRLWYYMPCSLLELWSCFDICWWNRLRFCSITAFMVSNRLTYFGACVCEVGLNERIEEFIDRC